MFYCNGTFCLGSGEQCILLYYFQAIDKELEQKEGYENYSAMQQQQSLASPWPNPMVQQQQKQNLGILYLNWLLNFTAKL